MDPATHLFLQQKIQSFERDFEASAAKVLRARSIVELAQAAYHRPIPSSLIRFAIPSGTTHKFALKVEKRAGELIGERLKALATQPQLSVSDLGRLRQDVRLLHGHAPRAVRNFETELARIEAAARQGAGDVASLPGGDLPQAPEDRQAP